MKTLYIISALFLSVFVLALCVFHLTYAHPPKEKQIALTPTEPDIDPSEEFPQQNEENPVADALKGLITKKNLFSPDRGKPPPKPKEEVKTGPKVTPGQFELVGVFIYGENAGAIILDKNKAKAPASPIAAPPRPGVPPPPGAPAPPAPEGAAGDGKKANLGVRPTVSRDNTTKHYYKLNDEMDNGFVLKKISQDSVLLIRGSENIELRLEKSDTTSKERIVKNQTVVTPPAVLGLEPPKPQPGPQPLPGQQPQPGQSVQPQRPPQPQPQTQPAAANQQPQLPNVRGGLRAGVRQALENRAGQDGQTPSQ